MISCFQLKSCIKCVYKICLKDFKLKKLGVEPKTAQPVESDEERVNPPVQQVEGCKKSFLSSRTVVQPVKM